MSVTAVPLQPVKRSYLVWLWVAILVLVAGAFLLARQGDFYRTTASGLKYHVASGGTGPTPTDSDVAWVMYVGRLPSGEVFDRSQQPVPMPVTVADPAKGNGGVIAGFAEGLKMMNKGARYQFLIPAKLAYGANPPPGAPIPPNSPLIFDVQVLAVMSREEAQRIMMQQMMMQQGGGMPGGAGGAEGGQPGEQVNPQPGK